METNEIKNLMIGRERDFLSYCGIPSDVVFKKKHQPCACGGKDRLRITETGYFFCNQGSQGDFFELLDHYQNMSFKESINAAKEFLGVKEMTREEKKRISEKAKKIKDLAFAKSKVKDENNKLDFDLTYAMDSVSIIINERDKHELPNDDEVKAYQDIIDALSNRVDNLENKRKWYERQKENALK